MKKIILGILSILITFLLFIYYNSFIYQSNFFTEIESQIFRIKAEIYYKKELEIIKNVFNTLIINDTPPLNWKNIVKNKKYSNETFYFFKIWFEQEKVTLDDIKDSYALSLTDMKNRRAIDMRYGENRPYIRVTIYENGKVYMWFPMNNCLYDADVNGDNRVDEKDLEKKLL